ncbi:hypothetical protein AYL99_05845 [Fonsecaea erecta]|uniref:Uncharacterized protein n=1 Tax=Fonsecaea erecta TaxID=1367422 RepID=A0A178ZNR6_9EURO|nr:hypothetical protein AYL99_05845 [Fonsecaea erecta]OAP60843.1 hypothetical protein AYL99_05845 [Fonsecaea erecta]
MARIVKPKGSVWNPRTVTAPIAAVVMAGLLYTYAVTSIRAAKRNAKLHREADGGQLDMRRESLRRHGLMDPVQGTSGYELFRDARADAKQESKYLTEKKAKPLGADQKEETGTPRTENESVLEGYRGSGALQKLKEAQPRE